MPNASSTGPSRRASSRKESRSYHHGALRDALVGEAIELIRSEGPEGFTLRELARRLGVSHAAPYRHFADRGALLTAVAALGCDELAAAIRAALDEAGADLRARFLAAGYAYVRFALDMPAHFRTMFESPEVDTADPAYSEATARCRGILIEFIRDGQQRGLLVKGDPEGIATPVWAMHHGLASLASAGAFEAHGPAALRGIVDGAHAALLDGLLVRGGEAAPAAKKGRRRGGTV
ncbi:MAG TPA: TetR/AcrR family transcriptional regulator [Polyangiaceae bacterium]|nr:TetR/AcrR family transcriptional regulator [Polyangiaceae bacterium]